MTIKIEEGKPYMTKGGLRWCGYSYCAGGDWPIHGAYQKPDGRWQIGAWSKEGKHMLNKERDLMPAPVKFVRERWVNVFADGTESIHDCKWTADNHMKNCTRTRIAVVPVKVEFSTGDGLEE